MSPSDPGSWVKASVVATRTGLTSGHVRRLVRKHQVPHERKGNLYLIDLEAFSLATERKLIDVEPAIRALLRAWRKRQPG